MITLQDAIERAKLAADESGLISSYTYEELLQQLGMEEQYAFTMALVDLGIQTKLGSDEGRTLLSKVIAQDFYDEEDEEDEDEEDYNLTANIVEDFVRVAQQYVQSPGGLWMPEDTGDEEVPTADEGEYESFLESTPFVFPHERPYSQEEVMRAVPESSGEFSEIDVEQLQETIEQAGLSVDAQGNVTLYQQNVPGLYTKKIPLQPMPLEKAIDRLNAEADNINKEQDRIGSLQDILAALGSDFQEIEMDAQGLLEKFDESYDNLEKFRYSERSPDENIRSIAEGLSTVRSYIEQSEPSVEELRGGLGQYSGTIQDLQGRLDNYYQSQYDKYDEKLATIDALERLKEMRDTDPDAFQQAVSGIGGVAAAFRIAQQRYFAAFDEDSPAYGSINIEVGSDFVKRVFEDFSPGQGEVIFQSFVQEVAPAGEFDPEFFEVLIEDLESSYGVGAPEGASLTSGEGSSISLVDGSGIEAYLGVWNYTEPDPSVGYYSGWSLDDHEKIENVESIKAGLVEDLGYYADMYMRGEL